MNAAALTPILWFLTAMAWISFGVLGWSAVKTPRIGALTERTFIAFILAMLGTVASVLRYNSDTGLSLFPVAVAQFVFAITMIIVLSIPTAWLYLFVTDQLGGQR